MSSVLIFISGAVLLIFSAEKLIGYLVGAASGLKISAFLLAIIFTGIEFDDVFLGVALNLEDLSNVALGTVFGTAISLTGVVLAVAAILTPVRVRIPGDYIALLAGAPLVMIAVTLTAPLTLVHGLLLGGLFVLFVAYVAVREARREIPVFRNTEVYAGMMESDRHRELGTGPPPDTAPEGRAFAEEMPFEQARRLPGWAGLTLALVALVGLIVGAATTGIGVEGILEEFGIEGTLFGATIVTAVLTIEDLFLTVEPIRRGAPEIGIGNVIGSVVFSVTGKLGVIIVAGGAIVVGPEVLSWHLIALITVTGVAAWFLHTGRLQRWHGVVLLALYVAYWVLSFVMFGEAPVETD